MSEGQPPGHLTDDLRPRRVDGPPRYATSADGPVDFVLVANADGVVLGYLWVADAADAAGFAVREAAGNDAFNAGVYWFDQLRKAKSAGLTPGEALRWLRKRAGGDRVGVVVPKSDRRIESLSALAVRSKND